LQLQVRYTPQVDLCESEWDELVQLMTPHRIGGAINNNTDGNPG